MNVIDSLVIGLGFDTSALPKGQREVTTALQKTREEATKTTKSIADSGNAAAEAISTLTKRALTFFALLAGAHSVKSFVQDLVASDSALGRFATSLGLAPQSISAFSMAIERQGGSASAAAQSFQSLSDSINEMKTTGKSSITEWWAKLQSVSGQQISLNQGTEKSLLDIADALEKVKAKDPAMASFLGRRLGLPSDAVNFLSQGRKAVEAALADTRRFAPSREQIEAFQQLQSSIFGVQQAATSLGRSIVADLAPYVTPLLLALKEWIAANKEWLASSISDAVKDFASYLKDVDWKAIGKDIKGFAHDANAVASALGGWKNALELFFGLWLGGKFLAVMANIAQLRLALGLPAITGLLAAGTDYMIGKGLGMGSDPGNTGHAESESQLPAARERLRAYEAAHPNDRSSFEYNAIRGHVEDLERLARAGHGGTDDDRNWWQRHAPRALGGRDAPVVPGSSEQGGGSKAEVRDYVRRAALARGIDPNVAVAVGNSEALRVFDPNAPDKGGDFGTSFGPFQLHYGGSGIRGMNSAGLGDAFTRKTGLNARDPRTWRQQIDFALDEARRGGWGPWHGAAHAHIGRWQGIGTVTPTTDAHPVVAAVRAIQAAARPLPHSTLHNARALQRQAEEGARIHNSSTSTVSNSHNRTDTTQVGAVYVSGVKDAAGFAQDLRAIGRSYTAQANSGPK